eukprot:scaffold3140_cov24-Cyclotella_meneghiniana.AAC.1
MQIKAPTKDNIILTNLTAAETIDCFYTLSWSWGESAMVEWTVRPPTRRVEVDFDFCGQEGRAEGCTALHSRALFSAHRKSQGLVDEALESP